MKVIQKLEIELTQGEVEALKVLGSYGVEKFIDMFEENMGAHYLAPHKNDLKFLLNRIKNVEF